MGQGSLREVANNISNLLRPLQKLVEKILFYSLVDSLIGERHRCWLDKLADPNILTSLGGPWL